MNRWMRAVLEIRRDEWPFALSMFGYFFLVVTTFWILKPLKKAAFVGFYQSQGIRILGYHFTSAQAELWAKVVNVFIAMAVVALFSWLSDRLVRHQLTILFSSFFLTCYALFSFALQNPTPVVIWSFYLFGDLFSTLMVATFFVFLNDSVTIESAKRLYGLIGLGGVLGGAFGSVVVNALVGRGRVAWDTWMLVCSIITVLIIGLAVLGARFATRPVDARPPQGGAPPTRRINTAIAGARLVVGAPYLLSIVSIVGFYEISSSLLDFQFTATVLHFVPREELDTVFSAAYVAMNVTAVLVQLFLTSFVMRRLGLKVALMILPIAILTISAGYMLAPILAVAILIPTVDGGFAYSVNQSAKEALYVPTNHETRYKAKAFIDMFVQRFAKLLGIAVGLLITMLSRDFMTFRWLAVITIAVASAWLFAVRLAGSEFVRLAGEEHRLPKEPLQHALPSANTARRSRRTTDPSLRL